MDGGDTKAKKPWDEKWQEWAGRTSIYHVAGYSWHVYGTISACRKNAWSHKIWPSNRLPSVWQGGFWATAMIENKRSCPMFHIAHTPVSHLVAWGLGVQQELKSFSTTAVTLDKLASFWSHGDATLNQYVVKVRCIRVQHNIWHEVSGQQIVFVSLCSLLHSLS